MSQYTPSASDFKLTPMDKFKEYLVNFFIFVIAVGFLTLIGWGISKIRL